jgi:hypothetical protein
VTVDEWAEEHYPGTVRTPVVDHRMMLVRCSSQAAECSCGWVGPPRDTGDPHLIGLLDDDRQWHLHEVGRHCQDPACVRCQEV